MAEKQAAQTNQGQNQDQQRSKQNPQRPKQNQQQQPKQVRLSPAALRAAQKEKKLQRKLERAARPDTMLIGRMALETNVMGTLVDRNDYLIRSFRDRVGLVSNIPLSAFGEIIAEQNILRARLNAQNKRLATLLEEDYTVPGGYDEGMEAEILQNNPPGSIAPITKASKTAANA